MQRPIVLSGVSLASLFTLIEGEISIIPAQQGFKL